MGKYKFVGGGQKKGENQKRREKQWQIADSSLWGTLKPKIEEKPNWIPRKGRHKKQTKTRTKQKPRVYQTSSTFG